MAPQINGQRRANHAGQEADEQDTTQSQTPRRDADETPYGFHNDLEQCDRMNDVPLDLIGLKCPLPALKTRKALKGMPAGAILRVICTDPLASIDIPNLVRETGDELLDSEQSGGHLAFRIRKAGA
jgi:tRNA 2-thiouridine synthesizing protein A